MNILLVFLQKSCLMSCDYFRDSGIYREIYDWFKIIEKHYLSSGKSKKESRWLAYDSIEQRFNVKYSRARVIVKSEEKKNAVLTSREKSSIYTNNKELIDLIQIVNEEYSK